MKRFVSLLLMSWVLLGLSLALAAQGEPREGPPEDAASAPDPSPDHKQAPPRSDVESSSKDSKIDLSPPPNDARAHPDGGFVDDVMEFHSFSPLKAMKDIEVGDYYFKQKNYRAALSRYREALEWKPRDAEATLRLGRALEKTGHRDEARLRYQEYLQILPQGPGAPEAQKALERLANSADKKSTPAARKK